LIVAIGVEAERLAVARDELAERDARVEEEAGDLDDFLGLAAGIAAQVNDDAGRVPEGFQRPLEFFMRRRFP